MEMLISTRPTAIKISRLLSDVVALNNNMPPTNPRNNTALPAITIPKDKLGVISGEKIPASNAKNPSR